MNNDKQTQREQAHRKRYPDCPECKAQDRKPVDGMDERYGVPMDDMRNCNTI